jgi:ElaB/YqjD/DUF883 family membrane-anchored ribosome-binding protein
MPRLWLPIALLALFSTASSAQTRSSTPELQCDPQNPDRCTATIKKSQPSPVDGVVMTTAMALALKANLDEAVAKVAEEKRYCLERLAVEDDLAKKRESILTDSAKAREALLQAALDHEQERSKRLAAETEMQAARQWWWGAGGAAVGLLVGAVVTGSVVYYGESTKP